MKKKPSQDAHKTQPFDLKEAMDELRHIAQWFDMQDNFDLEQSLVHLKKGAQIVSQAKKRLKDIENEFEEIKKEIESLE